MAKVQFSAHMKPSARVIMMHKHSGNLSEGNKAELIATRRILGHKACFYANGEHTIDLDIPLQEQHDSVILRFAHASLIAKEPVGVKDEFYVDAKTDPCEVWINGVRAEKLVKKAKQTLTKEFIFDDGDVIPKMRRTKHVWYE